MEIIVLSVPLTPPRIIQQVSIMYICWVHTGVGSEFSQLWSTESGLFRCSLYCTQAYPNSRRLVLWSGVSDAYHPVTQKTAKHDGLISLASHNLRRERKGLKTFCDLCILLHLIPLILSSFLLFKFAPTDSAIILPILKHSVLRNRKSLACKTTPRCQSS